MDIDRPSLAAAALYDLKNEQLQLANAALQQQAATERHQQGTSTESKQQDQPVAAEEGQNFRLKNIDFIDIFN